MMGAFLQNLVRAFWLLFFTAFGIVSVWSMSGDWQQVPYHSATINIVHQSLDIVNAA